MHTIHLADPIGEMNMDCPDCRGMIRSWLPSLVRRERPSEVEGWMLELTDESMSHAVSLAVVAAGMCWDPAPTGKFQSAWADQIAKELISHIRKVFLAKGV
jgi:hypothetical protein